MAENSGIQWTDHTFNPWWGCQKVSPGCDHCYAETLDKRTGGQHWGPGAERRRTSAKNWNDPWRWNAQAEKEGKRFKVFCASMADVFDNAVPAEWREDLWQLIRETPHLDWMLLTKRIGNAPKMLPADWPFAHVGLMISVVNQEEAERDIPKLLAIDATWRGLSCEPLLGPIDLSEIGGERVLDPECWGDCNCDSAYGFDPGCYRHGGDGNLTRKIDWVIVGGESGKGARPMHPEWARLLRDQCVEGGVPFFFKQWGEWAPGENASKPQTRTEDVATYWGDRWLFERITPRAGTELHCDDEPDVWRFGKKNAGRLLDGREWNEFPKPIIQL